MPTDSLESRLRDLGAFIREQRLHDRLSLRKLSELAGISNPYLSQIERGLRKPSAEILQAIARGLQISSETLYVRAGILDGPNDAPDLVATISADSSLTDRQKRVLIDVYRSFRTPDADDDQDARPDDRSGDDADGGDPGTVRSGHDGDQSAADRSVRTGK